MTLLALIDIKDGRMVLRVGEEEVLFKLQATMRHSMDLDVSHYFVDHVDDCGFDFVQDSLLKDELGDMSEEEPLGEIYQKEERKEATIGPLPRRNGRRGWSLRKRKEHPRQG